MKAGFGFLRVIAGRNNIFMVSNYIMEINFWCNAKNKKYQ
jgi:hypothetical protein